MIGVRSMQSTVGDSTRRERLRERVNASETAGNNDHSRSVQRGDRNAAWKFQEIFGQADGQHRAGFATLHGICASGYQLQRIVEREYFREPRSHQLADAMPDHGGPVE